MDEGPRDPSRRDGAGEDEGGGPYRAADPEIVKRCAGLEENDTGNALRLLAHFGDRVLYVRDVGWHVWDGRRWSVHGGEDAVTRFAQETARRIREERRFVAYTPEELEELREAEALEAALDASKDEKGEPRKPNPTERATLERAKKLREAAATKAARRVKYAIGSGNAGKIAAMAALAAAHQSVDVSELDAEPLAINCRNGTLRVIQEVAPDPDAWGQEGRRWTVRLDPHRQEDRISKMLAADYDPAADAPRWRAFLERFVPDPAVRGWLQRFHGYALTGLMGAQQLAFNHGLGANGKTTFAEALRRLMGDYAAALPAEAVTGEGQRRSDQATPEWARLPGVRLVIIGELPRNQSLKEETIKLVTGGEPMLVRHLNRGFVEMRPVFKAVMAGNHKPMATGSDYAVWRRLRLVPWTQRLEEHERRPMDEVLGEFGAEASGILNWCLEGLFAFLSDGLGAPDAIASATEEYRAEMDPVGEFVKECVKPYPGNEVDARAMFSAYILWCKANAVREWTETRFAREMARTGIRKKNGRVRKYIDVDLKDVPNVVGASEDRLVEA